MAWNGIEEGYPVRSVALNGVLGRGSFQLAIEASLIFSDEIYSADSEKFNKRSSHLSLPSSNFPVHTSCEALGPPTRYPTLTAGRSEFTISVWRQLVLSPDHFAPAFASGCTRKPKSARLEYIDKTRT